MLGKTFYEHFTPLIYPGGHMGHFLLYFLLKDHHKLEKRNCINIIPKNHNPFKINSEWLSNDIIECIFGTSGYQGTPLYLKIKKHYPNMSEITLLNIYIRSMLLIKYTFNLPYISWPENFINDNFIVKDINENKILDEIILLPLTDPLPIPDDVLLRSFKYLKFHHYPYLLPLQNKKIEVDLGFHNKIHARFSKEKLWIPLVLSLYKYINHFTKINTRHNKHQHTDITLPQYYSYIVEDYINFDEFFIISNNDTIINMDKLILNQDVNEIYKVEPDFIFNKEKQKELALAHNSTMEILTELELDPQFNSSNISVEDILAMGKIKKLTNNILP